MPGENRTTSPGLALAWARSTASASEFAISHSAAPLHERRILSAISPIKIVDLTFSFTRHRSGSKLKPLFFPPAMRMTGLFCARSALSTASRFVALESFIYPTPPTSRTNSHRCGRGSYAHSGGTISANDNPRAMPAASVAIKFSMLCKPRSLVSASRTTVSS